MIFFSLIAAVWFWSTQKWLSYIDKYVDCYKYVEVISRSVIYCVETPLL